MSTRMVEVAEARDIIAAQIWIAELKQEGIDARVFEQSPNAALGGAVTVGWARYPVLVAEDDFGAARAIIGRIAGMQVLVPLPDTEAEDVQRRWVLIALSAVAAAAVGFAIIWQVATR